MRIETVRAWIFLGFGLLMLGTSLYMLQITGKFGILLAAIGLVYFLIGTVLSAIHNRHMIRRTQAGRE